MWKRNCIEAYCVFVAVLFKSQTLSLDGDINGFVKSVVVNSCKISITVNINLLHFYHLH